MENLRKGWAEGRDEKDKKMWEFERLGKKGKRGVNITGTSK